MDVFVYGTLTESAQVDRLLDDWQFGPRVELRGCHRADGEYPTLVPGGDCRGRILQTSEMDTLDRYEGVERGLYTRVSVPWERDDEAVSRDVQVYVGDPERLDVAEPVSWPGEGPLFERVETYCRSECTVARLDD
ncbi:gamma-glutamylcyclotransferase family protein [Haloarchaeobius sp. DFWS5]|uniref:gamma-glutamylcyclotransferase family protein n=1 Tax=Haloarchaeobius sp. DFWS5 TaxID=3446114 RepID=UPI003EB6C54E